MVSQEASQAIPLSFNSITTHAREELKVSPEESREAILMELSGSDGWKVAKDYLDIKRNRIMQAATEAARGSSDTNEIGLKFLMATLIVDVLNDFELEIEQPRKVAEYVARNPSESE
jgi:hypothetical protein